MTIEIPLPDADTAAAFVAAAEPYLPATLVSAALCLFYFLVWFDRAAPTVRPWLGRCGTAVISSPKVCHVYLVGIVAAWCWVLNHVDALSDSIGRSLVMEIVAVGILCTTITAAAAVWRIVWVWVPPHGGEPPAGPPIPEPTADAGPIYARTVSPDPVQVPVPVPVPPPSPIDKLFGTSGQQTDLTLALCRKIRGVADVVDPVSAEDRYTYILVNFHTTRDAVISAEEPVLQLVKLPGVSLIFHGNVSWRWTATFTRAAAEAFVRDEMPPPVPDAAVAANPDPLTEAVIDIKVRDIIVRRSDVRGLGTARDPHVPGTLVCNVAAFPHAGFVAWIKRYATSVVTSGDEQGVEFRLDRSGREKLMADAAA